MNTKLGAIHKEAEELHMAWTGSCWQHYQGGLYTVLDVAVDEASGEIMVIYRDDSRRRWVRKLSVWCERVNPTRENPDGVPRFEAV